MAKVEGLERVLSAMRRKAEQYGDDASCVVGYTAAYAIFVHENRVMKLKDQPRPSGLGVYWGPNGRAGFLLDVAREMAPDLGRIVKDMLGKGEPMGAALLTAGLRLQRESQQNVPVEYGNLKGSAFTRLEKGDGGGNTEAVLV